MKEINVIVEGGKATAGPPLGPALGPLGINTAKVVEEINKKTSGFSGIKVPVKVIVDPSTKEFSIEVGSPPVSELLKKRAGIEKGSGSAWKEGSVGNISLKDIVEISNSIEDNTLSSSKKALVKEVLGTALSIGLTVDNKNPKQLISEINEGKHTI